MPAVSAPEGHWARSAAVTGGGAGVSLPLGRPVEAVAPCRGWGSLLRAEEAGRGGLHPVHFSNLIWGLGKWEHPFSSWPQSACLSANLGGLRFPGSLLPGGAPQNVLPGCCGEGGGGALYCDYPRFPPSGGQRKEVCLPSQLTSWPRDGGDSVCSQDQLGSPGGSCPQLPHCHPPTHLLGARRGLCARAVGQEQRWSAFAV